MMFKYLTSLPWVPATIEGLVPEKEIPVIQVRLPLCKNEYRPYIVHWHGNYFFNVYFFSLQASSQQQARKQPTVVGLQ